MTTRGWFLVHSFAGATGGLLLFVVCWSGTFATLAHEIDWLVTPEARVEPAGQAVSWGQMLRAVREAFPEAELHGLQLPGNERAAAQVLVDLPRQSRVRVYVDPYSGTVQGAHSYLDVWRFFRSFHRRLFIRPPALGIFLVSALSLVLGLSIATALVFYKRWWRRFFRFKARRGTALWSELHKLGGLWSLWFAVLMTLTGLWYGLEQTTLPGKLWQPLAPAPAVAARADRQALPLDTLVAIARRARPDLQPARIEPPGARLGMALRIDGQAGDLLVRDRVNHVVVDAYEGEVVANRSAADLSAYQRWVNTADPLHFGDFAGLASKLVWFVFGLALSGLCLTGAYLYARRQQHHAGRRWPGTAAAMLVSAAVVAAAVPFGFHEARAFYGPRIDGVPALPSLAPGVWWVIVGWSSATVLMLLGWCFALARPAARARRSRLPAASLPDGEC